MARRRRRRAACRAKRRILLPSRLKRSAATRWTVAGPKRATCPVRPSLPAPPANPRQPHAAVTSCTAQLRVGRFLQKTDIHGHDLPGGKLPGGAQHLASHLCFLETPGTLLPTAADLVWCAGIVRASLAACSIQHATCNTQHFTYTASWRDAGIASASACCTKCSETIGCKCGPILSRHPSTRLPLAMTLWPQWHDRSAIAEWSTPFGALSVGIGRTGLPSQTRVRAG
jgi:hypothetical protein